MKKILAITLIATILCSLHSFAFAVNSAINADSKYIVTLAERNSEIIGEYKHYMPFKFNNQEIRLYSEPVMTITKALETYADVFEMCAATAQKYGFSASLDNAKFVDFAKVYAAMNENGDPEFVKKCKEFAVYLDYYENIEINRQILDEISSDTRNIDWSDIISLMPSTSHTTVNSAETIYDEEPTEKTRASAYNTSAVTSYASAWWNKTNNDDYPYYAEYNGMSTSRNDYNDLDDGRSGQSNPPRSWSDCADFVSQCLSAGGVPQIKSGLILPHRKTENWYYNDSKPSHTWGGANNFYNHWSERAGISSTSTALGIGDAISIDFGKDGSADHTVIIVATEPDGTKYLASHTADRYMYYYSNGNLYGFTLSYLYGKNWNVYGYEIDKIF